MPHTVYPALLHGGPGDGRSIDYSAPMPLILVIAEYVEAQDSIQPGLRYFDYRLRERTLQHHQPAGPYHYDYVEC